MIEIKQIAVSKLLKIETKDLVEKVVIILEKCNPEALQLHDLHTLLLEQKSKVKILTEPYGEHIYTEELKRLHARRLKYASLIHMQVRAFEKMDIEETQSMAKTAKKLTKYYLTYLGRKNRIVVYDKIYSFFSYLKNDAKVEDRQAFAGLGLQPCIDELKKTNDTYYNLYLARKNDIRERTPTGGAHIEQKAQKILRLFFDQVNSYQEIFQHVNYSPLIREINVVLTGYSKSIKTRIATNKRRAKKKAANAAGALNANDGMTVKRKGKVGNKGNKGKVKKVKA